MIENLDELEKRIASHFGSDLSYRLVFEGTHPKTVTPRNVGYLARIAYQRGVLDTIEYVEELLKKYNREYLDFKLKQLKMI